jgi:hypothetical protein
MRILQFTLDLALVTVVPFFTMFGITLLAYLLTQWPW